MVLKVLRTNFMVNLGIFAFLMMLFLPNLIKLNHVFENDQHIVCAGAEESHFHEIDHDCDFKLKHNNTFIFSFSLFDVPVLRVDSQLNVQHQDKLSSFQSLSFQLRAPPVLI